jgi:hypothetical protein
MTATAERPATRPAKKSKGGASAPAFVPRAPQVNLLPPEVRAARSLSAIKRWLAIGLVVVLAVVALGYGGAVLVRSSADTALASAEDDQMALRAEEGKYAEVPRVLKAITATTDAREVGMATEISWRAYLDAIAAVLPAGMSVDDFTLTGPSPIAAAAVSADPLQGLSIGTLSLQLRSSTAPVTSDLLDALDALPGIDSPWVSSVATAEENGSVYYSVALSAVFNDAALAGRFSADAADATETAATTEDDAATDAAAPTEGDE